MATNRNDDEYKPVSFYQKASEGRKRGFTSFSDGDVHYFALVVDGDVAMISQAYTSVAGRDNGIESVKKNMTQEKRYRFSENAGAHGFGLFAGNGQEIAISPAYKSKADAEYAAGRMSGKVKAKRKAKPAKAAAKPAKAAAAKTAKPVKAKAPRKRSSNEDEYRPVAFYEANSVANGFNSFEDDGEYFFGYYENNKLVWMSESYPTKAARDVGVASVKKNKGDERKIKTVEVKNGRNYRILKAGNGKEIARSGPILAGAAAAAVGVAALAAKPKAKPKPKVSKPAPKAKVVKAKAVMPKAAAPIAAAALATGAIAAAKPKPKDKDDDYLPCKEYHGHTVTDKVNNVAFFKHSDGQFYFAMYDEKGDVRIRSEGFRTANERDSELSGVLRLKDNSKYYKRIEKGAYFMDVLHDETGREVGRSCLRKKAAPVVAAAPIAAAAAVPVAAAAVAAIPAAAPVAAAPAAAATGGFGFGWLKWLLLALLALLALFLLSKCFAKPTPAPVVVPPKAALISCWDGSEAANQAACPTRIECWDGSFSKTLGACPVEPAPEPKAEVIETPQTAPERVQAVLGSIDRICGPSSVTLFDVPNYTPKSVAYLGSNPQYGESHGLTPAQFHAKLADAASFGGKDRAFLNYMARSLGYGSFKDMDASMFSNDTLNRGEKGLLGFARTHSLQYSKLDVEARDLEAFRVRAANGQDVHFMKSCGNFMYVCQ